MSSSRPGTAAILALLILGGCDKPDGTDRAVNAGVDRRIAGASDTLGTSHAVRAQTGERAGAPAAARAGDRVPPIASADGRRITPEELSLVWTRGGSQDDSLVTIPFTIAADSERVVVYDAALATITAYSAVTGEVEWVTGRRGSGPGEFSTYVALNRTPSGEFLALDWHNLRLTYLEAATGRILRAERWRAPVAPMSACVASDGSVLALTSSPELPLVWLADSTSKPEHAALPWPALREAHPLVTQAMLAAGPG